MDTTASLSASAATLRKLGRFELRQLLGKSVATMAWHVFDPRAGRDLTLFLPRRQPGSARSLERWMARIKQGERLNHPHIAPIEEVSVQEQWPYVAVDRSYGVTLGEWLAANPTSPPDEMVEIMIQVMQGLAYAHEAGVAHLDVQLHALLINAAGQARWAALGAGGDEALLLPSSPGHLGHAQRAESSLSDLQRQRQLASRDLLGCGLIMHRWIAGRPALDEPDMARVIARLSPFGHEILRLPFGITQPVPEALRAIVNRCTAHQERQRYQSARTLLRALEGWRQAQALESGGPLALLMDRLHSVGHLPASPGLAQRVSAITSVEGQHADEVSEQVLQDVALTLELVRISNSIQVRGSSMSGSGPILAIRRSVALLGIDGVRRAANSLRLWPGPLQATEAGALRRSVDEVRLAAYAAQALRPAGYDPDVIFLVVVLQKLGHLLVRYHFPDEAQQIDQLMQPADAPAPGGGIAEMPGLSETAATFGVLGVDFDALRTAVIRQWGLGDEVLQMVRPLASDKAVRKPASDAEVLRTTASAAVELVDAGLLVPAQRAAAAIAHVASRYARVLKVRPGDFREALQNAVAAVRHGRALAPAERSSDPEPTGMQELGDEGQAAPEQAQSDPRSLR